MSSPVQTCTTCDRRRNCLAHKRAEFPPDAAAAWLRRTCPQGGEGCQIEYRAGVDVEGLRAAWKDGAA